MGAIRQPMLVTPLAALLLSRAEYHARVREELEKLFGPVELESEEYAFTRTDYYKEEMGESITRRFVTFKNLRDPYELPDWKKATNAMEQSLARELAGWGATPRPINIDAGYLAGGKLVLASTKDHARRIYMRDGIYAEMTLAFERGLWRALDYTFPDYREETYHVFLSTARNRHIARLKESKEG